MLQNFCNCVLLMVNDAGLALLSSEITRFVSLVEEFQIVHGDFSVIRSNNTLFEIWF